MRRRVCFIFGALTFLIFAVSFCQIFVAFEDRFIFRILLWFLSPTMMSVGVVLMGVGAGGRRALGSGKSMQVTGSTIVVVFTAFFFHHARMPFSLLSLIGGAFLGGPGFVLLLTGTLTRLLGRRPTSPVTASIVSLGL